MGVGNMGVWTTLKRQNKTVLMIAGVWLLGYAISKAIYTFTDVTAVGAFDVSFGGLGLLVTVVGLVGLYPRLRDEAPRLSFAGLVTAVVAAVGNIALLGWLALATLTRAGYPAIPEESPAWTVVALIVVFVTMALGFLLFGAASLRTDIFSRPVGWLLVVPGLGWAGLIVGNLALPSGQYLGLVYVPICLALLGIGYSLDSEGMAVGRSEPAPDSTA